MFDINNTGTVYPHKIIVRKFFLPLLKSFQNQTMLTFNGNDFGIIANWFYECN
jgi:hypothetical protein